jgi:BirA family biotin operon repressor/biotin-[acetyl-CoA-carboxylase] ligase
MPLPLLRFGQLNSTQDYLREHPELGFGGVLADTQTDGRGRWGNRWESAPRAGFYFSAAVPDPGLAPGLALQRAMLHAARRLDPAGNVLGLKWPNDLVARRGLELVKVGGILGEVQGERLLIGLGVNFTAAPALPGRTIQAASLADLGLEPPDCEALAAALLEDWQRLGEAREPAFRWPAQGDPVRWESGGQGMVLGWEADGRLRIANAAGVQRLAAGEVSGIRPPA